MYKNNARALLPCISSILNLDWLQHACSVRGVYELFTIHLFTMNFGIQFEFQNVQVKIDEASGHYTQVQLKIVI